ncbi:S8 family peptidase [Microbacterium resistens]
MTSARARRTAAGLAAVAAVLAVGVVAPAHAADQPVPGGWYIDQGGVPEAHAAGFRGQGVTIAVIDSQINPDVPALRGADLRVTEPAFCRGAGGAEIPAVSTDGQVADHGTQVVSTILGTGAAGEGQWPVRGVAPEATVLYYAGMTGRTADADAESLECLDDQGTNIRLDGAGHAFEAALDAGADIVSISLSGPISGVLQDAIARAHAEGVVVLAAMPNDTGAVTFPAGRNGVVTVQALDEAGQIMAGDKGIEGAPLTPNTSESVVVAAPGIGILVPDAGEGWTAQALVDGTSLATPIVAGSLAVLKSRFPEASGNQLIQTMLGTTGGSRHEPAWRDDVGYGPISLTGMLADDPLSYPDVNPLFDNPHFELAMAYGPTADEVAAAGAEAPATAPETASTTAPAETAAPAPWGMWAVAGGALVVVGGAFALVLGLGASRRRRAAAATTPPTPTAATVTDENSHGVPGGYAGAGHDGGKR